jgi:hypothetical protein
VAFSRTVPPIFDYRPGTHEHYSPPACPPVSFAGEGGPWETPRASDRETETLGCG